VQRYDEPVWAAAVTLLLPACFFLAAECAQWGLRRRLHFLSAAYLRARALSLASTLGLLAGAIIWQCLIGLWWLAALVATIAAVAGQQSITRLRDQRQAARDLTKLRRTMREWRDVPAPR
jgi:hypothetical protein